MPRSYRMAATIEGKHVGFNLKKPAHKPTYAVFFRSVDGRRQKRDTKQTSFERAKEAAVAILTEVYGTADRAVKTVTWEEAATRLKEKAAADGLRAPTIDY